MTGVKEVFPEAEHRECMFHLVTNFKKKFHGKVFDDHLWAAAYSWNPYLFGKHWAAMETAKLAATAYVRKWHNRLWSRSQFSTICKVDYVTNNLAESFNNWIKHHKSLNLDDFFDKARQLIMILWNRRRKVAKKLDGLILPHIMKRLNVMTRELNLEVVESSEEVAEVTALGGSGFRFVVNLQERTCSCRQWQVSGLPCKHALAFITSLTNAHIRQYVDLYYSLEKFRSAYAQLIPAMPDKNQWPQSDHGFFMHPPLLKATAGRPKTERYKGYGEKKRKNGKHLCLICKEYGHHWHNCKKGNPDDIAAMMAVREPPKKRTKTSQTAESSIMPYADGEPTRMCFPPSQNLETTTKKEKKEKHANSSAGASKSSKSLENTSKKKGKGSNSESVGSKRSGTGSNQPEPISIEFPMPGDEKDVPVKAGKSKKRKCAEKIPMVPVDSLAMCTRSKFLSPASPAMNTRSKRRLSL
ncbi:hypothetical protein ACQ4PT_010068 [Festuca glaucescens]